MRKELVEGRFFAWSPRLAPQSGLERTPTDPAPRVAAGQPAFTDVWSSNESHREHAAPCAGPSLPGARARPLTVAETMPGRLRSARFSALPAAAIGESKEDVCTPSR